jgi:hypothetical protein
MGQIYVPNVPTDKARAVVDAMERDMSAILATKSDIALLRQDIEGVRLAAKSDLELLRQDIEGVRSAAKGDTELLRQDLNSFRTAVRSDNELLRASMTIRLGSMLLVAIGVLFTALTLTLHWVIR